MSDVQRLLERQAEWQKRRKSLSWPEKLRMVEAIWEFPVALRREEIPIISSSGLAREPYCGLSPLSGFANGVEYFLASNFFV